MAAVLLSILLVMDGSPWFVSQTWEIFIYAIGVRPLGLAPIQETQVCASMVALLDEA